MFIVLDLLLVAVFVFIVVFFSKNGLTHSLHKLGKVFLSVFCTFVLGPWASAKLEALFFRAPITNGVYNSLSALVEKNANGYNLAQIFEKLPEGFVNFLHSFGADLETLEAEFGSHTSASDEILHGMAERIADPCIGVLSSIIGHIVCFLVPLLVMLWLEKRLENREKHKFLRVVDHITGGLAGLILGYGAAVGLAVLTNTVFQVVLAFDSSSGIMSIYNDSYVCRFLNEFDTINFMKTLIGYFA